jgi:hypothetical protein
MWPFDIFAKRRAAKEAREHAEHMDRVKASIEAANKRQRVASEAISKAQSFRAAAAPRKASLSVVPSASDVYTDPLNPINHLSPLNPINQVSIWQATADEPRHSSHSHCDTSSGHSSHSSSDYPSHSHSSHDHSCSSNYDSGSSSSYDSGSSSSGSDF